MAQEKNPDGKPKRTRKPKAGKDAPPVEQITELMPVSYTHLTLPTKA